MKQFLVILGLTALVWLGVSMAEEHEYPVRVRVQYSGYDTVRYAVLEADTVLDVQARMSGFNALMQSLLVRQPRMEVTVDARRSAVGLNDLNAQLRRCVAGARTVSCTQDSVHIRLAERRSRSYQPRLDNVEFSFTDQYGLYGEPRISPAEVILYGPQEALDSIKHVSVATASIRNVNQSGTYELPLEPVWEQYADVHPSVRSVEIYLPVEAFVEHQYQVPVSIDGADTTVTLRLYPSEATVRVWLPQREIGREPSLKVSVDYSDVLQSGGVVTPRLVEFPSYVRPRSVEPKEIQCVVIK